MERAAGWRAIEPSEDEQRERSGATDQRRTTSGWLLIAGLAGAGLLVGGAALLWIGTPQPQLVLEPGGEPPGMAADQPADDTNRPAASEQATELIVDVEGAVVRPGLHRLPAGSRVGDAIAAAGGYGPRVDIRAAAERLNLAERLVDGAKIHVPVRGDPTPPAVAGATDPSSGGGTGGAPGGPIEINGASQAQLETLPGIGPVTAGKIIAAREEARFATIDELLSRKVVGPATFEKIRPMVTVAP